MSEAHNFCFPIRTLANERVKMVPFSADLHAQPFIDQSASRPDLYAHMPSGPFSTLSEFLSQFLHKTSLPDPSFFTYAIIDKTRPPSSADAEGELAGMMSFMDTSPTHLSTEIGYVLVLPNYQRTHVTTNAVGLMLQYALDDEAKGGLGLRRVQWKANERNEGSIKAAERLGFRREGLLRWHFVFRDGERKGKAGNGRALPRRSDKGDLGRDTVVLGVCWDDWEEGAREVVEKAMARRV